MYEWILRTPCLSMTSVSCDSKYLKGSIIKEHHEGAVRLEPLQQVEPGHVRIRHTTQVPALREHKSNTRALGLFPPAGRRIFPTLKGVGEICRTGINGGMGKSRRSLTSMRFSSM